MWKVSVDYDEVQRYKRSKAMNFEGDSEASDEFNNSKRLENTVYNF